VKLTTALECENNEHERRQLYAKLVTGKGTTADRRQLQSLPQELWDMIRPVLSKPRTPSRPAPLGQAASWQKLIVFHRGSQAR
jgi:hypothetical protein